MDDLLGIWGASRVTGKPALADLRCRKKSLPVLAALSSGTPAGARLRALYGRVQPFSDAELPTVADLIEQAGGRAWAQRRAEEEIEQAHRCLAGLEADASARIALEALADYVVGRDR